MKSGPKEITELLKSSFIRYSAMEGNEWVAVSGWVGI